MNRAVWVRVGKGKVHVLTEAHASFVAAWEHVAYVADVPLLCGRKARVLDVCERGSNPCRDCLRALHEATKNKYGARKVEIDGYTFDSKREAERYEELRLLQMAGKIRDLICHPEFELWAPVFTDERPGPNPDEAPATLRLSEGEYAPRRYRAKRVGYYTADFAYKVNGLDVVEDVKSKPTRTEAYRLRKKIVEASYGIKVTEIE